MKSTILVLLAASLVAFAAPADQKSNKKQPAKAQEITVPAGAVEIAPYTYRFTDAGGKTWIYRKTPFGISRTEDKPMSAAEARKAQDSKDQLIQSTTALEEGDSIHFTRNSPFGPAEWRKKKSDLNEIEQAVWSRELAKQPTPESASKD